MCQKPECFSWEGRKNSFFSLIIKTAAAAAVACAPCCLPPVLPANPFSDVKNTKMNILSIQLLYKFTKSTLQYMLRSLNWHRLMSKLSGEDSCIFSPSRKLLPKQLHSKLRKNKWIMILISGLRNHERGRQWYHTNCLSRYELFCICPSVKLSYFRREEILE